MRLTCTVKVKNSLGLHIRPASYIAQMLQKFKSSVFFTYKEQTVNARSIMSILALAVTRNSQIKVVVDGEDAHDTMEQLRTAFERQFGE